jgi:hypothetical protein
MKVTSAKTLQALRAARGERTWSEFAAAAKRDQSGAIIVRSSDASSPPNKRPRPKGDL